MTLVAIKSVKGKKGDVGFKIAVIKALKDGKTTKEAFESACKETGHEFTKTMAGKNASSLIWGYKNAISDRLKANDEKVIEACKAAGIISEKTDTKEKA